MEKTETPAELRKERNKKFTKGGGVVGVRQETIRISGSDEDIQGYVVVIDLSEHCRTDADIRAVMKEKGIMGTITPMRVMKDVTQSVKEVTAFE